MEQGVYPIQENRDDRAQGLVEFAIILPIMLFILFGIVEIGRIMQSWILIENGVREGASYASSLKIDSEYCTDYDCDSSEINNARLRSIHDVIWTGSSGISRIQEGEATPNQGNFFKSLVCLRRNLIHPNFPHGSYQCVSSEESEVWQGEHVVILIEYNHSFLVPFFFIEDTFLPMTARRDVYIRDLSE